MTHMYTVVGGGIAGLAAAYRLQQHGHDVHVYEASEQVGGLAAVHETAGDPIEKFYHHLSKSEETIVELAEELGVGDRVSWRVGENAYYVDGVVHPLDKPWEILAYPHLSTYDKFRLGMLTLEIDVRGGFPELDAYTDLEAYEDVPVKEFLLDHASRGVYDQFFEPLLDAKFGDRKTDVSAAWLLGRIKFRGERDILRGEVLGYFDGSISVLLDALVEAVGRENITTGARVTDIGFSETDSTSHAGTRSQSGSETGPQTHAGRRSQSESGTETPARASSHRSGQPEPGPADGSAPTSDGGEIIDSGHPAATGGSAGAVQDLEASPMTDRGVESVTVDTGGASQTHSTDGVIVAAMPNVLESLTGYECSIDFQGAVCAVVTMDESLTDTYWLNIKDDVPFGALIEHTNFVSPETYGGDHLLYVASYIQSREDRLWQASDAEVEQLWLDGIADLFPTFDREAVSQFRLSRNPRAAPVYERGYLDTVVPYDLHDAVGDGVHYAGMASRAQYPERSLNGGVVAGFECADRIKNE